MGDMSDVRQTRDDARWPLYREPWVVVWWPLYSGTAVVSVKVRHEKCIDHSFILNEFPWFVRSTVDLVCSVPDTTG